jgi:autotransporter translocation and assembly factor TamB
MKRLWRFIRWMLAAIVALILAAVGAILLFTRTARFNDLLRIQVVTYLAQTYHGQITIGSIEGSIWGNLTLHEIAIHHQGSTIAAIPQVRVGYQILPALRGQIVLSDIDVVRPELHLARDPDGQWNLLAALTERNPSPPSSISIALRRIAIEQAAVTITTAPGTSYDIGDANIVGAGHVGISGQSFTINAITFALSGPKILPIHAQGAVDYDEAAQVATIRVPGFSLWTSRSKIDFNGTLRDLSAKNIAATTNLRKLAAADLNSIEPRANPARDISGIVRINGNASNLQTTGEFAAGDARIDTTVHAEITKAEPVWKMEAQLAKVDLRKLLKPRVPQELPAGVINATVHAGATGFEPAGIKAAIDARVAGLGVRSFRLGDLSVSAALDRQIANLKALLAGPGGRALLAGRVDIAKVPTYDATLKLDHLHPANFIHGGVIPAADLNVTASVSGSGYQPDTISARTQLRLLPSTLGQVRIDSGRIDAQLASGLVQLATVSLKAGDTTLDADGQVALDPRRSGFLRYKVLVGQASQWLALARRRGSGRVDLVGQVRGNLRALRAIGSADLSAVRVDRYSVGHARLTYDVGGLGTSPRPEGQAMLLANNLNAGIELKSLQTSARLMDGANPSAVVDLSAEDRLSHQATMHSNITYRSGLVVANLTEMAVGTGHGSWQLTAPAQFTQRGPTIEIRHFTAVNQDQTVALDATLSRTDPQDLTLRVQRIRLADFSGLTPARVKPIGLASAELTVHGSAAAPIIAMSGSVADLNVANFPQAQLSMQLSYGAGRAQAQATLVQDAAHSLTASGTVPFQLSWARGFESRITGDADLRAVTAGLDLAVLNAINNPQLGKIGGTLTADVSAHGPLLHPLPHGYIRLIGVHASITHTRVDITQATAEIQLAPREVRLTSMSAKAGKGVMTGDGAVTLSPDGRPERVDLRVALDQWPAIATHQYNATMAARIDASGPAAAIRAAGRVELLYGIFRPDLSVTGSAPRPDDTITVVHRWSENPQLPPPPPPSSTPAGPIFKNLAIEMDVVVDRNTWIKTADFELEGQIHISKKRGRDPIVYGTINTVHGTLVVAQREFDLTRGRITFTGDNKLNPELLIVAERRVQNYQLFATVGGNAKKPTLTFSSIPDLPQADILSVMMFGKTSNNLSGGQQNDLQNQAISMAGGYAASQIGQAVAKSLGLSSLGVTTSSGGVGLSRYLGKNIYVSASQSASNMQDRRAEIQYYITPSINLNTSASTNYGNEIKLQWHKDY